MQLFFCNNIQAGIAILSPEESGHCIRVLRLAKGDLVKLIDGTGTSYDAEITIPDSKKCELKIIKSFTTPSPRNYKIHIAIAPTKNIDRFEWFVEKAVEIGVDAITPVICERSERRVLKTDRLHKLIISTMKQAMILNYPRLDELNNLDSFFKSLGNQTENRFIAHCFPEEKKLLSKAILPDKDVIILIGPEGDFTQNEVKRAISNHFLPVSLGTNRLRTETAGIVACHTAVLISENHVNL